MNNNNEDLIGDMINSEVDIFEEEIPKRGITITVGSPAFYHHLKHSSQLSVTFAEYSEKPMYDTMKFWLNNITKQREDARREYLLREAASNKSKPKDWYRKFEKKKRY